MPPQELQQKHQQQQSALCAADAMVADASKKMDLVAAVNVPAVTMKSERTNRVGGGDAVSAAIVRENCAIAVECAKHEKMLNCGVDIDAVSKNMTATTVTPAKLLASDKCCANLSENRANYTTSTVTNVCCTVDDDPDADDPYAELEFYLENVKVNIRSVLFVRYSFIYFCEIVVLLERGLYLRAHICKRSCNFVQEVRRICHLQQVPI